MRHLVVNADDFGFTRDVNRGIIQAHTSGILTATTLMANGQAFHNAVELARDHPDLDVGCHLMLVQGESVSRKGSFLPCTLSELTFRILVQRWKPYTELRAQILRILDAGIRPLHVDTHKHTHLLFPVLEAVARLSEEFGIPWVRRPFDFPLEGGGVGWGKRSISKSLGLLRKRFHRRLAKHGCRTTDHFAGFQITGDYRAAELVQLLQRLPAGSTEFMTHPGLCTNELRGAKTRLKESREEELRALTAIEVRDTIKDCGIALTRYRDL